MPTSPPPDDDASARRPNVLGRVFGVLVGAFLGGIVGLFFGIGLACFGMTMWLWLVIPLTTATLGGVIGFKNPIDVSDEPDDAAPPAG